MPMDSVAHSHSEEPTVKYIEGRPSRSRAVGAALALLVAALAAAWAFVAPSVFSQAKTEFAHPAFQANWERTDGPIVAGAVKRPYIWGPGPSRALTEPFLGIQGNSHFVQYFDKGRMELNDPNGNPKDPFFVTNGLLAVELVSGQLQTGTATYESRAPAAIDLASDPDDPTAPTYQSFNGVANIPGAPNERRKTPQVGQPLRTAIDRQGVTQPWPQSHPDYGVRVAYFEETTGHNIPDVFWNYLNTEGLVLVGGDLAQGRLFDPWFKVSGLPISEAYWSYVKVEGRYTDVLTQVFERRVLTFIPHLPTPFKVQMGNIGQHYYEWRYLNPATPVPTPRTGVVTPTAPPAPSKPNVTIDDIQPRTSLIDLNSNYCTITNRDQGTARFDGWYLDSPKFGHIDRFYFPDGVTLQPGASMKVHAGPGNNSPTHVYMYRTTVMWDGQPYDFALLYDNLGREVDSFFPAADKGAPTSTPLPGRTTPTVGVPPKETPPTADSTPPPKGTLTPTRGVPSPQPSTQATAVTGSTATPTPTGNRTATPTVTGTPPTATVTTTATPTPTRAP